MFAHIKKIKTLYHQGVLRLQTLKQESKILWQVMRTLLLSGILLTLLWKTQAMWPPLSVSKVQTHPQLVKALKINILFCLQYGNMDRYILSSEYSVST